MLNTKYFIVRGKDGQNEADHNPAALGNAWFVKDYKIVADADSEIMGLSHFNAKTTAIVDTRFSNYLNSTRFSYDSTASIKMKSYEPNDLVYTSQAHTEQLAVFSEIYYDKGWKMLVDGVEKPYFRADYVLRAAQIPAGNHKIEFIFHPASYYTGETISLAGSILLLLALGGAGYTGLNKKKEAEEKKPAKKKS